MTFWTDFVGNLAYSTHRFSLGIDILYSKTIFASRLFQLLPWLLGALLLAACSDKSADSKQTDAALGTANQKTTPTAQFISKADLANIRKQSVLRLIAPRFDGPDSLTQAGIPELAYESIAEDLAKSLGVEARWHYVDGFADLIPALNSGRGDLIVTNLTITGPRQQKVSFTTPINKISEVLITHRHSAIDSVETLGNTQIAVPEATAYLETLENLDLGEARIKVVDRSNSNSDLLDGLAVGNYGATVLDSDIARSLIGAYPDLKIAFTINPRRDIAWATRQENPELLSAVNQFLVSHHIQVSAYEAARRDWEAIKNTGHLRMLTTNNPASYFMYRGELMGFDYELLKFFAQEHDLHLSVIVKEDIESLFTALKNGEGDLVAASITRTPEREASGLMFSRRYLKVTEQLVGVSGGPKVSSLAELDQHSVGVNPQTSFHDTLLALESREGIDLDIIPLPGASTEIIFDQLSDGDFDFALGDSHLVAMEQTYKNDLVVNLDLTEARDIAWVLRPDQTALKQQLDDYIRKSYRGLIYNVTYNKYFKNARKIVNFQAGRLQEASGLSPYDDTVKPIAKEYGMDWRLITAQMYQESQFDPQAVSFAGAAGLMQLMPRTAKQLGYSNLHKPENSIRAGIEYMNWLQDRFPFELAFEDRIYFTLAAYNVGVGHVRDAQRLARQQSLDPNRWFGQVERAMLLLSRREHYHKSRFGYVRGHEPVNYVRQIRDRYLGYINAL